MEKIIELIRKSDNLNDLKKELEAYHPYDIASAFDEMEENDRYKLYRLFDNNEMADIFSYLDDSSEYIEELNTKHAASILTMMDSDDAADIINDIDDDDKATEIMSYMDSERSSDIALLTKYDENQAGALMTTNFISVSASDDVKDAMKKLIKEAPNASDIDTIFALDNGKLAGVVDLKKLILAKHPTQIDDIMDENFHYVYPETDIDETLKVIKDYDIYSLPVIQENKMLGIITMDDALQSMVNESNDDYAKFSGLTSEEEYGEGTLSSIKKRIPWLAILLVLDFFVTLVISSFEKTIAAVPILVFFQAVILGLAGNAGTQSLAVSVRRISQGELNKKKPIIIHLVNELLTGITLGAILGAISLGLVTLFLFVRGEGEYFQIALAVGTSIFVAMCFSSLFGAFIPVLFDKLHIDPAVASGPFITTLNDILAVLIYFGVATLMIYSHFI